MARTPAPPMLDVRPLLQLRADSVWLDESRMVLTHSAALQELRNELIQALGLERARGVLVRTGFIAGRCDAQMLRRRAPGHDVEALLHLGPALHGMEGLVRARLTTTRIDASRRRFYAEGVWDNSWEDELHSPGLSGEGPACWNQIGYVSGFASGLMDCLVIARETHCMSQGDAQCRLVIQDAATYADADYLRYFRHDESSGPFSALEADVAERLAGRTLPRAPDDLIGDSRAFREALDLLDRAAPTRIGVLLQGETGVGKERFARRLHERSSRAGQAFVAVNCAAMPGELIESELFGTERGAYTGAQQARAGRFERAHGGTLFLDEVAELSPSAQAKLLRALQTGEIERLGSERARTVDVRLVAATHVDLQAAVKAQRFRADLYYRLNRFPIRIPPLRERPQDLAPLVRMLLERYAREYGKRISGVSDRALDALRRHDWPGNVRELENVLERAVLLASAGGTVEQSHLPADLGGGIPIDRAADAESPARPESGAPLDALCERVLEQDLPLDALNHRLLRAAVTRSHGNLSAAARRLGLSRAQLAYRLRHAGAEAVDVPDPARETRR